MFAGHTSCSIGFSLRRLNLMRFYEYLFLQLSDRTKATLGIVIAPFPSTQKSDLWQWLWLSWQGRSFQLLRSSFRIQSLSNFYVKHFIYCQLYWTEKIKEKEAGNCPFKKYWENQFKLALTLLTVSSPSMLRTLEQVFGFKLLPQFFDFDLTGKLLRQSLLENNWELPSCSAATLYYLYGRFLLKKAKQVNHRDYINSSRARESLFELILLNLIDSFRL